MLTVFSKLKIATKLSLAIGVILFIGFILFGIYNDYKTSQTLILTNHQFIQEQLDDIIRLADSEIRSNGEKVKLGINLAETYLNSHGEIRISDQEFPMQISNQVDGSIHQVRLKKWYLGSENLQAIQESPQIIQAIHGMGIETITLFQRTPLGYVRIATNVLNSQGERAVGTFIPRNSSVVQTIESGREYFGRAMVVGQAYQTAYRPIYIQGKIEGMLYVGIKELNLVAVQEYLNGKVIFETGHPYIVNAQGIVTAHPSKNMIGYDGSQQLFFQEMLRNKTGIVKYQWEGREKTQFYSYYEPLDSYFTIGYYSDELKAIINKERLSVFLSRVLVFFLVILSLNFLMGIILKGLNSSLQLTEALSKGDLSHNIAEVDLNRGDEIGLISRSMHKMLIGFRSLAQFAQNIGQGNLQGAFEPLSEKDELGNALINMRQSLLKAQEEEKYRKAEDEKRNWATTGFARFADILRLNNSNLEALTFDVIKNLVSYTRSNQGGLFILQESDQGNPCLFLQACYAFDRKKFLEKTIEIGEGLVGTCYQEGQTIFMTDVPENYIHITSGLGDANPRCVLIVPLKLNDEIHGVLELASFNVYEPYEIEFIEKVAESIASTISGVKINLRTAELLQISQQQAEDMRAQEEEMRQNLEEMHATQEEMARKEAELHGLVNSINASMNSGEFKNDGTVISINENFLKLTGLKREDVIGKRHADFVPLAKEDPAKYQAFWAKLLQGHTQMLEYAMPLPSGKIVWLSETYAPVLDIKGNVSKIFVLSNDITEMKLQDQNLRAQEEELRQNLEEMQATQEEMARKETELSGLLNSVNASTLFGEIHKDGKILKMNDNFLDLIGIPAEEIIGKTQSAFLPLSEEAYAQMWNELVSGNIQKLEYELKTPSGKSVWLSETYAPILDQDGQIVKIVVLSHDISEIKLKTIEQEAMEALMKQTFAEMQSKEDLLKQKIIDLSATEQKLTDSQKFTDQLVGNLPAMLYQCHMDEHFTMSFVSPYSETLTGFKPEEFLEKEGLRFASLIHPEDYPKVAQAIEQAIGNQQSVSLEYRLKNAKNKFQTVKEICCPVFNAKGQVDFLQGFITLLN